MFPTLHTFLLPVHHSAIYSVRSHAFINPPVPPHPSAPLTNNSSLLPSHFLFLVSLHLQKRPSSLAPQLHSPQLRLSKTPHLPIPPKTQPRTPAFNLYLPHQRPSRRPHIHAIPATRIHIAINIALDPVRRARVRIRKHPSISKAGRVVLPQHAESVNGGCARRIRVGRAVHDVCVGHIQRVFIRGEAAAVGGGRRSRRRRECPPWTGRSGRAAAGAAGVAGTPVRSRRWGR